MADSAAVERMKAAGLIGEPEQRQVDATLLCSCGCTEPHVIATRQTADEQSVSIWSDGALTTGRLGAYVRGLGVGRTNYARSARRRAVRLIADDVSLWTLAELPRVVKIAESTFAHAYSSESDRRNHVRAMAHRALSREVVS